MKTKIESNNTLDRDFFARHWRATGAVSLSFINGLLIPLNYCDLANNTAAEFAEAGIYAFGVTLLLCGITNIATAALNKLDTLTRQPDSQNSLAFFTQPINRVTKPSQQKDGISATEEYTSPTYN